jgi:hypothetical protein
MHPKLIAYLASVEEGTTRILRYPAGPRGNHASCEAERNRGKIARFFDEAAGERHEIHFDQAAIAQVTIDLNRMEVEKRIGLFAQYGIWAREVHWLERLRGSGIVPDLRGHSPNLIRMSYVGEPVRQYNLPQNWPEQAKRVLHLLHDHSCCHNDIKCDNLTVLDGRLHLVDFGWATKAGEAIPSDWPTGIGRQHRLGIHRFDDGQAIYAALESAARGLIDRSIVMAR